MKKTFRDQPRARSLNPALLKIGEDLFPTLLLDLSESGVRLEVAPSFDIKKIHSKGKSAKATLIWHPISGVPGFQFPMQQAWVRDEQSGWRFGKLGNLESRVLRAVLRFQRAFEDIPS